MKKYICTGCGLPCIVDYEDDEPLDEYCISFTNAKTVWNLYDPKATAVPVQEKPLQEKPFKDEYKRIQDINFNLKE